MSRVLSPEPNKQPNYTSTSLRHCNGHNPPRQRKHANGWYPFEVRDWKDMHRVKQIHVHVLVYLVTCSCRSTPPAAGETRSGPGPTVRGAIHLWGDLFHPLTYRGAAWDLTLTESHAWSTYILITGTRG